MHDSKAHSPPAGEEEWLYLHVPAGRYDMPRQTLPLDLNVLGRVIPGSEIRSMTQEERRRVQELEKNQKERS